MEIGVLAVQGAFIEHEKTLERLGVPCFEIRQRSDLDRPFSGLILPGGESTTQGKLLRELGMFEILRARIAEGLPVFGTCAGLLLLAKIIDNDTRRCFSLMDIVAVRNAYGRQLGSFYAEENFGSLGKIPMTFIRAPYIKSVGEGARTLATVGGHIVAARERNMLVTAFHPELHEDATVYRYFLDGIRSGRI